MDSSLSWLAKASHWAVFGGSVDCQCLIGAQVTQNTLSERGWSNVYKTQTIAEDIFQLPDQFKGLQWHSETFELPKNTVGLAKNKACLN